MLPSWTSSSQPVTYKNTVTAEASMQDSTHDSSALRLLARNARNTKQTLMKQQAAARKFSSMLDLVNNELPPDRGECLKLFAKRRNKKQAPTFSHNFDDSAEGSDGCAENESGAVDENSVFAALETLRREQLRQRSSSSARSTTSRPKKSALPALTRGGEGTKRPATLDMESVAAIKRLKSQGNGLGALFLLGALELKAFPEIPCTVSLRERRVHLSARPSQILRMHSWLPTWKQTPGFASMERSRFLDYNNNMHRCSLFTPMNIASATQFS